MTIKKFLYLSVAVHAIIVLCIYFIPPAKVKKPAEFHTTLVSPEDLLKPERKRPEKRQLLLPSPRILHRVRPLSLPPNIPGKIPARPILPEKSLTPIPEKPLVPGEGKVVEKPLLPSPEKPAVPGEGKTIGKPLLEGPHPKAGGGPAGEGEVKDTKNAMESAKPGFSGRTSLFDRKTIEAIAKRDSGQSDKNGDQEHPITFDTKEYRYAGYMTKLREKIESIWVYPPEEARSGHYGDLRIQFTIKKDGKLGAIELVRTSGYPALDRAAMQALKDGEPYWPLPEEWGKDSYTILGHFIYTLNSGSYLR